MRSSDEIAYTNFKNIYTFPINFIYADADPDPGLAEPNLKKINHEEFSQIVKNIKHRSKLRQN